MIGEGDRQYLLTLIRREGIDQVLLAVVDVLQMGAGDKSPTELNDAIEGAGKRLVEAAKPAAITGPRIVSASPPKRASARRAQPQITNRIVTAAAPKRPKKEDDNG